MLRARTSDMIQLDGLQKIKELEVEDRYKVLEFLVKEMMLVKEQEPNVGSGFKVQYNKETEGSTHRSQKRGEAHDRRQSNTQQ